MQRLDDSYVITDDDVGVRARNCLANANQDWRKMDMETWEANRVVPTVAWLKTVPVADLLRVPNFGWRSLRAIDDFATDNGITLSDEAGWLKRMRRQFAPRPRTKQFCPHCQGEL